MDGREPGPIRIALPGVIVMGQTVKARALRCAPSRVDHIGFAAVQQPANKNVSNAPGQLMLRRGGGELTAGSGAGPD